jgi:hypothetical protein
MNTKRFFLPLAAIVIALIALNACKKDINPQIPSDPPVVVVPLIPVGNYPSGLGDAPGLPVCNPYILPANVEIVGEIKSNAFKSGFYNKETQNVNDFIIRPKTTFIELGSGTYVQVYLKFHNKNAQPTTVIIPGGLMFCPGDSTAQTGTTVQNDTVIIPGNDSIACHIRTYCTNLNKHAPNNTSYKMLGTTVHNDLWTVVNILKNKKKLPQGTQLQSIIWNITDHGGLTEQDKATLNALP